jgi:putative oxidoreductase
MSFALASSDALTTRPQRARDIGLLLLRIFVGLTIAAHGAQKLFGWFGGFGIKGTGKFLTSAGYPAGEAFAVVSGLCEFLGGLGLVLGLLTPLSAAMVLGNMVNAIVVSWNGFGAEGFFAQDGGIEYQLIMAAASAALAFTGPGGYALDRFVPGLRHHRLGYGVAGVLLGVVVGVIVLLLRS